MEPQVRDFELPQFTFLNNKPKKNTYGGKDFQNSSVQKSRGNTVRGPSSNKLFSHFPNFHPSQRNNSYQTQNTQNKNKFNNKGHYSSNGDYDMNYHSDKYAKGNGSATKANLEKKSYLAYASTADSDNAHISSELSGFKIVRGAHVIHDETEEDFDSPTDFNFSPKAKIVFDKYASSILTIGPNAKEISLPSFA
jgi:hypothetical protein